MHRTVETTGSRQRTTPRNSEGCPSAVALSATTSTSKGTTKQSIWRTGDQKYWRILGKRHHQTTDNDRMSKHQTLGTSIPQTQKGQRQNQTHHRPETTEQLPPSAKAQTGNVEHNAQHSARHNPPMGNHPGPQELLPPPAIAPKTSTVDENTSGPQTVPTAGHAFRLGPQPMVEQQTVQTSQVRVCTAQW